MKKRKIQEVRGTWLINPRTRIKKSNKTYKRQRAKQEFTARLEETLKDEDT